MKRDQLTPSLDDSMTNPVKSRLVNSRTSELAETYDLKLAVNNCY